VLKGKTVLLGVSGGIAAYKAAMLASDLVKSGATVHVLMTQNATEFISPVTFETLTGNKALVDTFDRNFQWNVEHVALAKRADVFLAAPATANLIAKFAAGIADDMLTTTFLACTCPKLVAPAMNTAMYENPITQRNMETLRSFGMTIVEPGDGHLACGDDGKGRLPDPPVLKEAVIRALVPKDLEGVHVLLTAGPTCEAIDPVRFITNHSSGKMGYQTALAALRRGAKVTLVSGPVNLPCPEGAKLVPVTSAQEMLEAVLAHADSADIIIKTAAVADYTPADPADHKVKKKDGDLSLPLRRTTDILATLGGQKKEGQVLVGFSMETEDLLKNSTAKLEKKNADMIVANSLRTPGAGFGVETNIATFITRQGAEEQPCMTKYELGNLILTRANSMRG
jgi:phosphopantothenoylcysteine decarboxylase/phosphopantothenate--cysteine ligase